MDKKRRILWRLVVAVAYAISYFLCRVVFLGMHGMVDWTNLLAKMSAIILTISFIFENQILSVATVGGYMGGFILAMMFNRDGVDPGGGRTNNAWFIWASVLFFSIIIGLLLHIISKRIHKNVNKQ